MGVVYILIDPRFEDGHPKHVRYVGITTRNTSTRMVEHLRATDKTHRDNWIRQLRSENLQPSLEVIDEYPDISKRDLGVIERYWIAQFKAWGFSLTNGTSGGDGIYDMSLESKQRQARACSIGQTLSHAANRERRNALSIRAKAEWADPITRLSKIDKIKSSWTDPAIYKRHIEALNKPDVLEKISDNAKSLWADPNFRASKIASQFGGNNCNARGVVHNMSGKVFDSAMCAERWLHSNGYPNASGSAIVRACKGKLNIIYGSTWCYTDGSSVEFVPADKSRSNNPSARMVICLDTGKLFGCMGDALDWALTQQDRAKGTICTIWRVCNNKGGARTAYGYRWRYATEEEISTYVKNNT